MSAELQDKPAHLRHGKRLSEPQKRAIIAAIAAGESNQDVAQRFGVHRNTVSDLVRSVRDHVKESVLSPTWRERMAQVTDASVTAVHRSVLDTEDIHKAATTAIAHLKGVKVYESESSTQVTVHVNTLNQLPADWKERYWIEDSTPTPSEDLPTNGAPDSK